jgi:hypothetical protein
MRLSLNNSYTTLYNIKASKKASVKGLSDAIENDNYIIGSKYNRSRVTRVGCFEFFRGKKDIKGIFSFTHTLYPEFVEKFIEEWNDRFKSVKIYIEYKKEFPIYSYKSFNDLLFRLKPDIDNDKFCINLYNYIFTVKVDKELEKYKVILSYLAHHVVRLFSCSEASMKGFVDKYSPEFNLLNETYNELGFYETLIKLNSFSTNPRRLYDGVLNKGLINKVFNTHAWLKCNTEIPRYSGQTSIINFINKIKVPTNSILINSNSKFYIKGRASYNLRFNIVNDRLKKAIILDKFSELFSIIKVIEHVNREYIDRILTVRDCAIIPIDFIDNMDIYPFEYKISNDIENYEIINQGDS